jgi:ribose transport system ATP-binding protein
MDNFKKNGIVNWDKVNGFAEEYLEVVGLDLKPTELTGGLTAAQKQLIQIAKAISSQAKYILMDEPTSSLTMHEIENLFKVIEKLKKQNVGIIFVSHKIEEVMKICDMVSVLRDGKYIGSLDRSQMSKDKIVKMMIGRDGVGCYLGKLDIKK